MLSNKLRSKIKLVSAILLMSVAINGCNSDGNNEDKIEQNIESNIDSTQGTLIKFDNTLFSIPSPYEIAFLVKNSNLDFDKSLLNPYNKSHNYTNNFQKALNLGVYGANLGYLNVFEQNSEGIQYFSVIKILSQELGIENAFDKQTITRIENNLGNKDSLMFIISNSYRKADQYLKDNNRNDIGVLILAGGWLESTYMLTQLSQSSKNKEIATRIGEQKHPLDNLIKILSPYYNQSKEYAELIDALIDLAYDFDGIDINYTYSAPTVDVKNKLTVINSKSELLMTDQQLKTISDKISAIRKKIVD
ncbi:MAG: hypothetical protein A2X08_08030 [Bacteroidetes bacterium GWA2_32_17]|nr:MAG: hypothetical protein A2X08_08030 [Bacteroidetes bacterium GWA2_32_17]